MAQSVTSCCNKALQMLGSPSIMNITDDGQEARLCREAYDPCRRELLRDYTWNFSIKRAVLAPDTAVPEFDFAYQFTLPTDCLRVLRPEGVDWVVEGRKVLTNEGNVLRLRYVSDVQNALDFDSLFYDLLAIAVAMQICEALTASESLHSKLQAKQKLVVSMAKKANVFEKPAARQPVDAWVAARQA